MFDQISGHRVPGKLIHQINQHTSHFDPGEGGFKRLWGWGRGVLEISNVEDTRPETSGGEPAGSLRGR